MTTKSLLALDLGTTTGFVCGSVEHHISGVWQLKPDRFESAGMRFVKLRRKLDEFHKAYGFTHIVFEEVHRHAGTAAAHVYGGLLGKVQEWCADNGVDHEGVGVGTIKKFATGKGNAKKEQMVEAVRSWGYETDDDNEADAIALFRLKAIELGGVAAPNAPALT